MSEMDEIIKEFLVEGNDHLDRLDNDFVAIEQNPTDRPLLSSIFRSIHTIKGGAGLLGFTKLEKLTHAGESLLALLRDGKLILTSEMTTTLLAMVDAVRKMFMALADTGNDGSENYPDLIERLAALQQKPSSNTSPEKAGNANNVNVAESSESVPHSSQVFETTQNLASVSPDPIIVKVEGGATPPQPSGEVHKESNAHGVTDTAIRVDVSLLDKLMNLAGELVLARNHVLQFASKLDDGGFQASIQRINQITSELREGVMKTRMQPIGNIWGKFPRIVRDLAKACGKQVALEMDGEKTELDKTLIEAIRDPLTHLIRNAVDHGIETPEVRRGKGKPSEGRLTLRAYHEGGQVNIEIIDDGGGIDPNKIFNKAVEKGLLSADQKGKMDEREMLNLIFLAGFSTAEKVTNVSGRGVGMDVVKTNIEKIGGTIDIVSKMNKGSTFRLKIPLTLAIIPALTVSCGKSCYAIPQLNVVELLRLNGDSLHNAIEMFQDVPVYRLRGKLLPIVNLNTILDNPAKSEKPMGLNIVVMRADEKPFGMIVDEIIDTQEIVVKPLSQQLKDVPIYAGATMMGDGKIALILDVLNIAQVTKIVGKMRDRAVIDKEENNINVSQQHQSLLLIRGRDDGRIVIPLSIVARLEEFPVTAVEWSGSQAAIQYRGEIIPLIHLSEILPERRREVRHLDQNAATTFVQDRIQAIVYSKNGRTVGIIVEKVLDIVDESHTLQKAGARQGVIGTMVIQDRLAEVLDVEEIVSMAIPDFFLSDRKMAKEQGPTEVMLGH